MAGIAATHQPPSRGACWRLSSGSRFRLPEQRVQPSARLRRREAAAGGSDTSVEQCVAREQRGSGDHADERVPEGMPDGPIGWPPAADFFLTRLDTGALVFRGVLCSVALRISQSRRWLMPGEPTRPEAPRRCDRALSLILGCTLCLAAVSTSTASAEDTIKFGKWEYLVTDPGVTRLPSGMQPSPNMRLGPEGLTFISTRCITATGPFPMQDTDVCKVEKTDVNGGTLLWSVNCTAPKFTTHQEWVLHFHAETMDGQFTVRITMPDHPPIERTQQVNGRYLGPCTTE